MPQQAEGLIDAVAARVRRANRIRRALAFTLIAAVGYALSLLAARLGLIPDWHHPLTILLVPALGIGLAWLTTRTCARHAAARLVDGHAQTHDLFLTHTSAGEGAAVGEYGPLVEHKAQERAAGVDAAKIVPMPIGVRFWQTVALVGGLAAAAWLAPGFDVFGVATNRAASAQKRAQIAEKKELAEKRTAELKAKPADQKYSKKIAQALEELKKTFDQLKPKQAEQNRKKLAEQEKRLGAEWKKLADDDMRRSGGGAERQRFGAANHERLDQWNRELRGGDAAGLQQQMDEIQQLAEQLAQANDDAERERIMKEMREKIDDLNDFADRHASTTGLQQAMDAAQEAAQAAAGDPQLAQDAAEAIRQAMEQGGLEAEQLAQQLRDMEGLAEAMEAIRQAQQMNQQEGGFDGEVAQQQGDMQELQRWLKEMAGQGQGGNQPGGQPGDRQPGPGGVAQDGGLPGGREPGSEHAGVHEGESTELSPFRTERVRSAIEAGQVLMSWKTREQAPSGDGAKVDYSAAVEDVKQGAAEALLTERVPPGYHEDIQRYFDELPAGEPGSGVRPGVGDE